jgi:WD40 repeat protein
MGRPDSELYRGVRLAQALDWQAQSAPELAPVEQDFLAASRDRVDAEVRAAREQARREAAAGRRNLRLAVGLAVALVLALLATGLATWYQREADERASEATVAARESDANELAAISKSVAAADLSLLLAARALRTANTPATQDGLLSSLVRYRRAQQVVALGLTPKDVELGDKGRTLFVSAQSDVLAWDVGSRGRPRTVARWDQPEDIAASPTGDLVALWSVNEDESPQVGVFDSHGRRHLLLRGFDEIGGFPTTFGFSRDGRRLRLGVVTVVDDGRHRLGVSEYDVASGRRIRVWPVQRMTPEDDWLWTSFADDGTTALGWVLGSESRPRRVDLRGGDSVRLEVRNNRLEDSYFATTSGFVRAFEDGSLELYDRRGRFVQQLVAHKAVLADVVVSPELSWAATADESGTVLLWDIAPGSGTWSPREELVRLSGGVAGLGLDRRGGRLVTVAGDGTAMFWDVSPEAGFGAPLEGLGEWWISNRPQVLVPGEVVVAPTRDATESGDLGDSVAAVFIDPGSGRVIDKVVVGKTDAGTVFGSSVAVSPDRRLVAVTHGSRTVVLDAATRDAVARIVLDDIEEFGERYPEPVWAAGWSQDGSRLWLGAAGTQLDPRDGNLVVVDTTSWKVQPERIDIAGSAQTMELSPDGELLAVGLDIPPVSDAPPGVVKLLDPATDKVVGILRMGRSDLPVDLSFSPDGRELAVATISGDLFVFDVSSRRPLRDPTKVHNDYVQQVEWLDDRNVVTTGSDGMIALYDATRGLLRASMPASADARAAYTYLLSVSEQAVAALSGGAPGRAYPLDPRRWLAYACVVAGRDLTRDEWASYLPGRDYEPTCPGRS